MNPITHGKNDTRTPMEVLRDEVKGLGEREATGAMARLDLAMKLFEGVQAAAIVLPDPKDRKAENPVGALFDHFQAAKAAETARRGETFVEMSKGSYKTQLSKVNAFAKYGAVKGYDTAGQLRLCREVLGNEAIGSKHGTFDSLLIFIRAEMNEGRPLTRAEMIEVFNPTPPETVEAAPAVEPEDKPAKVEDEGTKLAALLEQATSIGANHPSAEIDAVREALAKRLGALVAASIAVSTDKAAEAAHQAEVAKEQMLEHARLQGFNQGAAVVSASIEQEALNRTHRMQERAQEQYELEQLRQKEREAKAAKEAPAPLEMPAPTISLDGLDDDWLADIGTPIAAMAPDAMAPDFGPRLAA